MENFLRISGCSTETALAFLAYKTIFKVEDIDTDINFKNITNGLNMDNIEFYKMKKVFKDSNLYYKYKISNKFIHGNIVEKLCSFIPYCTLLIKSNHQK